ncbi:WD repeat-containing protein [Viridothelium virens]|uniref:DNA damage-binding protein CMR1 n=1 Tax=Viridothelium virens TaxID=1048519 RepID=A0A6A6GUJ3_VIRVR|nr:WD repeat-containing protein [Viridothelium virens]
MARGAKVELSDYELQRQEKIAKNQALLKQLNLEAASAGVAPKPKPTNSSTSKSHKKKPTERKIKEEVAPRRTSSRLKGIVADSEVAKRKAEEEREAIEEANRAKRQRISDDLNLSDIVVAGKSWNQSGNFLRNVGPANPGERTFSAQDVKETTDKELRALREKMSGLQLWEEFEPNRIKITPERIYSLGFHPTTDKPLVFAGDKLGNLGLFDASQNSPEVKKEDNEDEDEDEEAEPEITTFKTHTRTISAMHFSPTESNILYTASYDSSIRKLDLAKGVAVEVYAPTDRGIDAPLSGVEIPRTEPHMVYFTTLDGQFGMHDMRTSSGEAELLQLSDKKIGGFSLHPALPHLIATASLDRTMKLWDLRKISGKGESKRAALVGEHESRLSVSHAAFNSAGQVATASYDDTVKIYDFSSASDWKAGASLTEEQTKPATIIPHNNQTGRWVTILRAQWQAQPQDSVQRFVMGTLHELPDNSQRSMC